MFYKRSHHLTFVICLFVFTNFTKSATVLRNEESSETIASMENIEISTKAPSENQTDGSQRQRRLIPYSTFYVPQDLQHSQRITPYTQQGQKGYLIPQKIRVAPQQQQNPIPNSPVFSESNKLPGGFTPMTNTEQIAQQYLLTNNKNPDFGQIYDKLALYKQLVQQQLAHPSIGYASVPQQQQQQQHQKLIPIYKLRRPPYATPIRGYQNQQPIRYKTIISSPILTPTKTIVQSYTPQSLRDEPESVTNKYNSYDSMTNPYQPPAAPPVNSYPENVKYVTYQEPVQKQRNQVKYIYQSPIQVSEKPYEENVKYDYQEPAIITQAPAKYYQESIAPEQNPESVKYETPTKYYQEPTNTPTQKPDSLKYDYETQPVLITPKPEITNNGYNHETVTPEAVTITPKPVYIHTENSISEALKMLPHVNPLPQTFPPSSIDDDVTPNPIIIPKNSNSLGHLLKALQYSNALPQKFTSNNIGTSIKTLINILNALQSKTKDKQQFVIPAPNAEHAQPQSTGLTEDVPVPVIPEQPQSIGHSHQHFDDDGTTTQVFPMPTLDGGTPGKPGVDYPALSQIPQTNFDCKTQRYKGFFGDPETNCQVWHYCDLNGGQASFLCPNGTIFSQVALTCDWWYNVKCSSTPQLYVLNERLYKYILPFKPTFPEDFSGPLVDKYITQKFQEQEAEMLKAKKGKTKVNTESDNDENVQSSNEELQNLNSNESQEIDRHDRRNESSIEYVTSSKEVSNETKS